MPILLLIALIIGGGTSFSAEGALPGDTLYPIKINVNEEIRSFVSFSNEAQTKWDARRVEKRLEEAEKLAAEGRLNAEARANLESRFETHVKAFQEGAQKIDAKQNGEASLEVYSNFEASLKAHEQILARIATKNEGAQEGVASLLLGVRTHLNSTTKARVDAEANVSADAKGEFKAEAVEGKLGAATNKISEVTTFIAKMKSSVEADAYAQARAQLKVATDVIARGKVEMEAKTYGKAFASFQEAMRIAQEAKLLVATADRVNLKANTPNTDLSTKEDSETKTEVKVESEIKTRSGTSSTEVEGGGKVKIDIGL